MCDMTRKEELPLLRFGFNVYIDGSKLLCQRQGFNFNFTTYLLLTVTERTAQVSGNVINHLVRNLFSGKFPILTVNRWFYHEKKKNNVFGIKRFLSIETKLKRKNQENKAKFQLRVSSSNLVFLLKCLRWGIIIIIYICYSNHLGSYTVGKMK